jgi:hypothetical protein
MPNDQSERGKGKTGADESTENGLPRYAGRKHEFDDDTEEAFKLPKGMPEATQNDEVDDVDSDKKKADSAFEDQEIVVDEDELQAESDSQPTGRKY